MDHMVDYVRVNALVSISTAYGSGIPAHSISHQLSFSSSNEFYSFLQKNGFDMGVFITQTTIIPKKIDLVNIDKNLQNGSEPPVPHGNKLRKQKEKKKSKRIKQKQSL